jgi:hypothetical protein
MSPLRTGVTFMLGTMCGILVSRGVQRCQDHNHEARQKWSCPREASRKKTAASPKVEEATKTIPNN